MRRFHLLAQHPLLAALMDILPESHRRLTLSAGVVAYPLHGTEYDSLYQNLDRALYRAKRAGRNRVAVL